MGATAARLSRSRKSCIARLEASKQGPVACGDSYEPMQKHDSQRTSIPSQRRLRRSHVFHQIHAVCIKLTSEAKPRSQQTGKAAILCPFSHIPQTAKTNLPHVTRPLASRFLAASKHLNTETSAQDIPVMGARESKNTACYAARSCGVRHKAVHEWRCTLR